MMWESGPINSDNLVQIFTTPDVNYTQYFLANGYKTDYDIFLTLVRNHYIDLQTQVLLADKKYDIYNKIKSIEDDEIWENIKGRISEELRRCPLSQVYRQLSANREEFQEILDYVNTIRPGRVASFNMEVTPSRSGTAAATNAAWTHLEYYTMNEKNLRNLFDLSDEIGKDNIEPVPSEETFPLFNRDEAIKLAMQFDMPIEKLWKGSGLVNHGSRILENYTMNSLIKLCFDVNDWFEESEGFAEPEEYEGSATLKKDVKEFIKHMHDESSSLKKAQEDLAKIVEYLTKKDDPYIQLLHYMATVLPTPTFDSKVNEFLETMGKIPPDQYKVEGEPRPYCGPVSAEQIENFRSRLHDVLDDTMSTARPCDQQIKFYLNAYPYWNGNFINYVSETNKFETFRMIVDVPANLSKLSQKLEACKAYINYSKPFCYFEATLNIFDFTDEEYDDFLYIALHPNRNYSSAFLAAALHYYNVGTVYFDVKEMFEYNSLLYASGLETYATGKVIEFDTIYGPRKPIKNLYYLDEIVPLIASIIEKSRDLSSLHILCSKYIVPEIYLLQSYSSKMRIMEKLCICLLMLNLNISKYERLLLSDIIYSLEENATFGAVSGPLRTTPFDVGNFAPEVYADSFEAYYMSLIDKQVDISSDYAFILRNKSKYDFVPLFQKMTHVLKSPLEREYERQNA